MQVGPAWASLPDYSVGPRAAGKELFHGTLQSQWVEDSFKRPARAVEQLLVFQGVRACSKGDNRAQGVGAGLASPPRQSRNGGNCRTHRWGKYTEVLCNCIAAVLQFCTSRGVEGVGEFLGGVGDDGEGSGSGVGAGEGTARGGSRTTSTSAGLNSIALQLSSDRGSPSPGPPGRPRWPDGG